MTADSIIVNVNEDFMRKDTTTNTIVYLKDFTPRLYQENIFNTCTKHNTLVVLPTGVGKTAIFLMMAAYRLNMYPNSKILLLGPTRPLIDQYAQVFEKYFNIDKSKIAIFTGFVSPEKRAEIWKNAQIIFSTPQGLENDILSNKIDISNISLLGFDESHRATGEYSYNFIAKQYIKKALHPRIIALTASPGTDEETINGVCQNLFIEKIEVRSTKDEDVVSYVKEIDVKKIFVELPDEFLNIKKHLDLCYKSKITELKNLGFMTDNVSYSKKNILGMQAAIHGKISSGEKDFESLKAVSLLAEAIKVHHAIELVETQGIESLKMYMDKLQLEAHQGKTKATINLVRDINFRNAYSLTDKIFGKFEHPKFLELIRIITEELDPQIPENLTKKIIIFSQYRDSGSKITKELMSRGFKTKLFVGQAKKKDTGLSQKKQKEMIQQFSNSDFNVLVSSSVGEEGLDIPQVDLVIFYEPVPSAIRKIQRSGRTGRLDDGRIIMLIAKDTIDEIYYHVARNKERMMYKNITNITNNFNNGSNTLVKNIENKARTLMDYEEKSQNNKQEYSKLILSKIKIYADYREKGSNVLKELLDKVELSLEKLPIGDFILSKRVAVEYKNVPDFVDSIIDGRLLLQLKELKKYERPIIIIEGIEDIYGIRKIHPNSIRGMIATITVSYGIPLIQTRNAKDTAEYLISIAKREQIDEKNELQHHYKKPESIKEQQEYFISALPNIGMGGAVPLLKHFKNVKNIINASEKELQSVDLIGPKKSKSLKELFDKDWEE
jgi:Fanconi anemia group M protein